MLNILKLRKPTSEVKTITENEKEIIVKPKKRGLVLTVIGGIIGLQGKKTGNLISLIGGILNAL
ncbi:unnamed protein product, partial [marine sediment metagenome]